MVRSAICGNVIWRCGVIMTNRRHRITMLFFNERSLAFLIRLIYHLFMVHAARSLGCVFYELLCGQQTFKSKNAKTGSVLWKDEDEQKVR